MVVSPEEFKTVLAAETTSAFGLFPPTCLLPELSITLTFPCSCRWLPFHQWTILAGGCFCFLCRALKEHCQLHSTVLHSFNTEEQFAKTLLGGSWKRIGIKATCSIWICPVVQECQHYPCAPRSPRWGSW